MTLRLPSSVRCPPACLSAFLLLLLPPVLLAAVPPVEPEFCLPEAAAAAGATREVPESTRRLVARVQQLIHEGPPFESPYRAEESAEQLGRLVAQATSMDERIHYQLPFARALLRAGFSERAYEAFAEYERLLRTSGRALSAQDYVTIATSKAMAFLRLGEQENCQHHHSPESCLLPIRGGGVHQLTRGSRRAIELLTPLLHRYPGDLRARWLLNIAYMTLGEYPQGVPAAWRIDPQVFESDHDIKRFPDIAGLVGLDVDDLAGGVVVDDFDHDGLLDVMTSGWGPRSQLRFFRNRGDGTFEDRTGPALLQGVGSSLNLIHADYNNDGHLDVLLLRGGWLGKLGRHPNSLLRGHADGTFTDVTEEAGLLCFHPTQTAVWFDYNGDGWLDLFVGNESSGEERHPCQLYRNNGDGTFTDIAAASGVAIVGYVKGVVSGDFNNDGRPDLYLSRLDGPNLLLRNDGPPPGGVPRAERWRFTEVGADAGVTEPFRSFPTWFWDHDNDGWEDLMVLGYDIQDAGDIAADYLGLPHGAERARLYRNRGDGTFADVTRAAGLDQVLHAMGCNFGDLDNDGWLDCYIGTGDPELSTLIPNRMFRNDGEQRFQDVTTSGGFGQLQKGHGVAFADLDNDGDQDVYANTGGALSGDNYRNQLFLNPGHGHRWLTLKLVGTRSNRPAIGARIRVVLQTPEGERVIHRTVGSGSSFGAKPFRQEIGLGAAVAIRQVDVLWPATGESQRFDGLAMDRAYELTEGAATARPLVLKPVPLPTGAGPAAPHHHDHPHHRSAPAAPAADRTAPSAATSR